jgi:hypothetical protein
VQPVTLHQDGAVRVHIADSPEDTQEVETDDSTAVAKPIDNTFKELRFGDANGDWSGDTTDFEERV